MGVYWECIEKDKKINTIIVAVNMVNSEGGHMGIKAHQAAN